MTKAEKKLFIKTYGCQMNVYDSIKMEDMTKPLGYSKTENQDEADLIILNTCHIREKAAEKLYSDLGRIRKKKDQRQEAGKDTTIAVAGCVAQAEGDEVFRRAPYVDIVVGPQSIQTLPDLLAKHNRDQGHAIALEMEDNKFDQLPETTAPQGPAGFVSIQEGCDKFCTFCVVPYTRGAEYSRDVATLYRETMALVNQGSKEITLLGQNVNAYHGLDPEGKTWDLGQLIEHISTISGIERIRYSTSHPRDMHESLYKAHGSNPKLMPFLNLPVQSGANPILKAMNRKHSREEYFKIIDRLREERPDMQFSSDFIIGFPGETDDDFEATCDLAARINFTQAYSFKYSPRPGTPGAEMDNHIDEATQDKRLQHFQGQISAQQLRFNQSCEGKTMMVLFDRIGKKDGQLLGRSPYMQSVHVQDATNLKLGDLVPVKILKGQQSSLAGEIT